MRIIKKLKGYRFTCPYCYDVIEVNKSELEDDIVKEYLSPTRKGDRHIPSCNCPSCNKRVHLAYDFTHDIENIYEDVDIHVSRIN